MKKHFILIFLAALLFTSLSAQTDKDYSATLKEMFTLSGSEESFQAAIKQMFTMYREQYTEIDQDIWNNFENEFMKTTLDDLTAMLVPVYLKYLTQEDLEAVIEFYKTPAGMKYAKNTPVIMKESMQVGQQWGMKIAQEFQEKLKEKGY
ncbi:MAG TPA: DUF2059 domain-containing protein [Bacteroidales bacterium]|nr:DUF2059 domain-containing protein [Bacteroidales bacterium]